MSGESPPEEKLDTGLKDSIDSGFEISKKLCIAGFVLFLLALSFGVFDIYVVFRHEKATPARTYSFILAGCGVITQLIAAYFHSRTLRHVKDFRESEHEQKNASRSFDIIESAPKESKSKMFEHMMIRLAGGKEKEIEDKQDETKAKTDDSGAASPDDAKNSK